MSKLNIDQKDVYKRQTTELQAALCTVVIGAPRPSRPSGLGDSHSASAVMKGSVAHVNMIGFNRKR